MRLAWPHPCGTTTGHGPRGCGPRTTLGRRRGIVHNLLPAGRAPSLRRRGERRTDAGACRDTVVGQGVWTCARRSPVPGHSTVRGAQGIARPNTAPLHRRQNPAQYTTDRASTPPVIHTPRRVMTCRPATARGPRAVAGHFRRTAVAGHFRRTAVAGHFRRTAVAGSAGAPLRCAAIVARLKPHYNPFR
jgi:hypothetical protein